MTPEERAVIEAAERLLPYAQTGWKDLEQLQASVHALRESRKPKPRWQPIGSCGGMRSPSPVSRFACWTDSGRDDPELRDRILDALNRAEPV